MYIQTYKDIHCSDDAFTQTIVWIGNQIIMLYKFNENLYKPNFHYYMYNIYDSTINYQNNAVLQ